MKQGWSKKCMSDILRLRHTDVAAEKEKCLELLEVFKEQQDSYEYSFAKVYCADVLLTEGNIREILNGYKEVHQILEKNKWDDLRMVWCNLMGIVFLKIKDSRSALDSYFKGMKIAEKYHNEMMLGTYYFNIGELYTRLKDYSKAREFLDLGYHNMEHAKMNDQNVWFSPEYYNINIAAVNVGLGKYEEALKQMEDIEDESLKDQIYCLRARCYHRLGEANQAVENCRLLYEYYKDKPDREWELEVIYYCLDILIERGQNESAEQFLQAVYPVVERINLTSEWVNYYDRMIEYLERTGQKEKLFSYYDKYYHMQMQNKEELRRIHLHRINDRTQIEETRQNIRKIQQEGSLLKDKALKDGLTGIPNRQALNQYLKESLVIAKKENSSLGILFVDVDYFKQYNDIYGHLAGDDCLCAIGAAIMEAVPGTDFAARYGGDEFMAVIKGMNERQMNEVAAKIQENVWKCRIETTGSKVADRVTVTMGMVNAVPMPETELADYLHAADSALYTVKKETRNGYLLTNRFLV